MILLGLTSAAEAGNYLHALIAGIREMVLRIAIRGSVTRLESAVKITFDKQSRTIDRLRPSRLLRHHILLDVAKPLELALSGCILIVKIAMRVCRAWRLYVKWYINETQRRKFLYSFHMLGFPGHIWLSNMGLSRPKPLPLKASSCD